MGRPRAFEELAVLDASTAQFRVHGFADTSTEQLCAAAGVSRSSLYNAFVSKDELFVRSLERHIARTLQEQSGILTDAELSGERRLAALLDSVLDEEAEARERGHAAGCMIVATRMSPDIGEHDPRVAEMLRRYQEDQVALLAVAVEDGMADESLRSDLSSSDAALLVVSAISGIRVLSQSGSPVATLRAIAALHLDSLKYTAFAGKE
ncbi:TetR/AcrR family transcriptional regulator [Microbacterium sp. SA39]|uniref:TetR/AcrR family transcriptional regulator n=1 Tax=Microbacterium sp. SA39 TaxID=1263625 RepID=UPI0005FA3B9E|nr:TetR/AcrR family transcriptional regulator [Microbacterium sp. SA39]KJQ52703.1 HTH-type transcriptional repressor ComR [Microbacterium sp. SA39]